MNEFSMTPFQYENSPYPNYNMFNATGDDLERFMTYLVERGTWEKGSNYFFHNYNPDLLKRPNKSLSFVINPDPMLPRQPRNAFVAFTGFKGEESRWNHYLNDVKKFQFLQRRNEFLEGRLGQRNILEEDGTNRANVLMCFEVARRKEVSKDLYPLKRDDTTEAIDKVMKTAKELYELQAHRLIRMFDHKDFSKRKVAYDRIMNCDPQYDDDVDRQSPGDGDDHQPPGDGDDHQPPGDGDDHQPPGDDDDHQPPADDDDHQPPGDDDDHQPPKNEDLTKQMGGLKI